MQVNWGYKNQRIIFDEAAHRLKRWYCIFDGKLWLYALTLDGLKRIIKEFMNAK